MFCFLVFVLFCILDSLGRATDQIQLDIRRTYKG